MNDAVPYLAVSTEEFYVTNEADKRIHTALKGQNVKLHAIILSTGWTVQKTKVYFYFGPTTEKLDKIGTKELWIWQWQTKDVCMEYTIPSDLEDAVYYFAARTEDETEIKKENIWEINIVSPPPPGKGLIIVKTDPAGGTVYIDGEEVGIAPVQCEVPPGNHIVKADVGKDYVLKSCGCKECSMGEDNTCICTVEEGETITCTMKFEKVEEPAYMSALKYGMIGIGVGLLLYALSQTKAKEYIVVPAKKVGGAIRERISS